MHSSYSPLFTSGLLAERRAGSSYPHNPALSVPHPTGRRDTVQFPSFLSLDLADSSRSVITHRRKPSNLSKSTSWTCTSNITSAHDLPRIERPASSLLSPLPSASALRRTSRESLRQIPSPKPAPSSATLPEPPTSLEPAVKSSLVSTPPVPIVGAAPLLSPTFSSSSVRSTSITSRQKRKSRMDALACLEGRSRAENRIPRSSLRKNFMIISDDEGDESEALSSPPNNPSLQVEDFGSFADIEDEAEAVVPSRHHIPPKQATFPGSVSQPIRRKRRSTIDSWFPLKSFIDLKEDDLLAWNWRSFIEIGGI